MERTDSVDSIDAASGIGNDADDDGVRSSQLPRDDDDTAPTTETTETTPLVTVPTVFEFMSDYNRLIAIVNDGATRSFSFQRLQLLSSAFKTHIIANGHVENEAQSRLLGNDFFRTPKVDNHIHLAAAASAKTFVDFVASKLRTEPDTVVLEEGDTLQEVFDKAGLDADHLTIDAFNVLADYSVYQRFDNFNSKYSPFKLAQMRRIFLKVDNAIDGRFFAELTKVVFARHEASKGHESLTEMRLSVYGMERTEWFQNARWVMNDWKGGDNPGPVLSDKNRWMVQIPRLWRVFNRKKDAGKNFQMMLENIFVPIVEATLHPEDHPEVAALLKHVVGFDSVDDEGNPEQGMCCRPPAEWTSTDNPSYSWQLYYLWANIKVVNALRESLGLNTFSLRPHAGETGDVNHLAATYMLCESINHGINLDKQVSLQYLYYLDQVGLSVSPLSNNFLFRKMKDSPFSKFFKRGMNVTLSTDDPLLFHMSDDPLLEEYCVARASFDLSMTDMCELARNSIYQSGFEDDLKKQWLGKNYARGPKHCDVDKTHVPLIRSKFRSEHLAMEHMLMKLIAKGRGEDVLREMMGIYEESRSQHKKILVDNFIEVPDGDTVWMRGQGGVRTESDAEATKK
jgi:AMP deaminase